MPKTSSGPELHTYISKVYRKHEKQLCQKHPIKCVINLFEKNLKVSSSPCASTCLLQRCCRVVIYLVCHFCIVLNLLFKPIHSCMKYPKPLIRLCSILLNFQVNKKIFFGGELSTSNFKDQMSENFKYFNFDWFYFKNKKST